MRARPPPPSRSLYLYLSRYIHTYTYIYAVESKICPKIAFFLSQTSVQLFLFFFFSILFFFQKNILLSAGRIKFFKKKQDNKLPFLSQKYVQLCCAAYLDRFLTQPWPDFLFNLFHIFGPSFLFFFFSKSAETVKLRTASLLRLPSPGTLQSPYHELPSLAQGKE